MNDSIFIPKKIKIGFQKREDTFTKKLAYVIYYDEKNKLRKEQSWNSWCDKKITSIDCENVPTSGFVLNKKVGGYKYDWNVRNTYVRIYDPRDFEFEITVSNLLFILENANCIKGKGLEGDFVYGWSGSELLLIPTSSPDYVQLSKLNDLRHSRDHIKVKDLVLGATYLHKSNEKMIYMGRFNKYKYERWYSSPASGKPLGEYFYFMGLGTEDIKTFKSISDYFIEVVDNTCVTSYARLMGKIEKSPIYSPVDDSKTEYVEYTPAEFKLPKNDYGYFNFFMFDNHRSITARMNSGKINCNDGSRERGWNFDNLTQLIEKFKPCYKNTYLSNGKLFESTKKGDC